MLDLIVIGIIFICGMIGASVGFIKTVYQMLSSMIALVLAIIVAPVFEAILKLTPVYTGIQEWIIKIMPNFETVLPKQSQNTVIREATNWLPEFITEKIVANNNPEIYALLGVDKLIDYIVVSLTNLCITAIAIVIGWGIIKILLSVGVGILDLVAKLPLLKTANRLAGFSIGLIKGLFIVWMGCLIVPVLVVIPSFMQLQEMIQTSVVTKALYDGNVILQIVSSVMVK